MEARKAERWLRTAFLAGAIIDAAAMLPMLVPALAKLMWGLNGMQGDYFFAMGMGAGLMAGWTLLLIWAFVKPLERRSVALLTVVVIAGLAVAEIFAVTGGVIAPGKAAPSFALQTVLTALFLTAYFGSRRTAKESACRS